MRHKTVVLINARLGSTRLSQKHLLEINGRPILQYLIDAINREFQNEIADGSVDLVIATSVEPVNKKFEVVMKNCIVFYGSDENIPLRQVQAAKNFGADLILSVDGDDILCSMSALRKVYKELKTGKKLVNTTGLPLGMNASGYSLSYLADRVNKLGAAVCETGWGRVFDSADYTTIKIDSRNNDLLRFTLDYPEDFQFFSALLKIEEISSGVWDDVKLVDYVLTNKIYEITRSRVEEYWKNFNEQKRKEEFNQ